MLRTAVKTAGRLKASRARRQVGPGAGPGQGRRRGGPGDRSGAGAVRM